MGEQTSLTINGTKDFFLTITEVIRGDQAWQIVHSANMFNDEPPEGMEYVIVKTHVLYPSSESGTLELNVFNWSVVTKGRILDAFDAQFGVCCLEPDFDFELLPGGEADGTMAWPVHIDEPKPLMVLGGSGGIYFALYTEN